MEVGCSNSNIGPKFLQNSVIRSAGHSTLGHEMSFYCSRGRRSMKRIDGPEEQFYAIYRRCLLRKFVLTSHFFLWIVAALSNMKQVAIISDLVQ